MRIENLFRKHLALIVVISILCTTGCLSSIPGVGSNNTSEAGNSQKLEDILIRGKTTKNEVQQAFGKPNNESNSTGNTTWRYTYNSSSALPPVLRGTLQSLASTGIGIAGGHIVGSAAASGNMLEVVAGAEAMSAANRAATGALSGNNETNSSSLTITFDRQGVVKDYDYRATTNR